MKHGSPDRVSALERRYRLNVLRATLSALARSLVPGGADWRRFLLESWGYVPSCVASGPERPVWIASGSGGELVQCQSLCRELKARLAGTPLLLSTTNRRSLDFAKGMAGPDRVFYSPWDLLGACRRAVRRLRPALLIQVETPFHPLLAREARRSDCVTLLVSGFMGFRYDGHQSCERPMAHRVFEHLDWVLAKSESDRDGFMALGVPEERVVVLGDLRFDLEYLAVPDSERDRWRSILGLAPGQPLLVAGSVRAGEEAALIDGYLEARRSLPHLRLLLAPRFVSDIPRMAAALRERGVAVALRSEGAPAGPSRAVTILDSFGELPRLYSLASFVFLGGSLVPVDSRAAFGQNLVEPLAQGAPIFFGPHMSRWDEIVTPMTAIYPGLRISGAGDLARGILELDGTPELVGRIRALARRLVQERGGGLREHVAFIQKLATGGAQR